MSQTTTTYRAVGRTVTCVFLSLAVVYPQTNTIQTLIEPAKKISPSCSSVPLAEHANNAKEIAEALNGITEGITVRALGKKSVLVCGDDTNGAVKSINDAATAMSEEQTSKMAAREAPVVRLFFNRDATTIVAILAKAFPKLGAYAMGSDTIVLGSPDGSDAGTVANAKRWIAALDIPRAELNLNVWSVQITNKNPQVINRSATAVRLKVAKHNRDLQTALARSHSYLASANKNDTFYAPHFAGYLRDRYVVVDAADPVPFKSHRDRLEPCKDNRYCLGYTDIFHPQPTISSLLINVVAAKDPLEAMKVVNALEDRLKESVALIGPAATLVQSYRVRPTLQDAGCEAIAAEAYRNRKAIEDRNREPVETQWNKLEKAKIKAADVAWKIEEKQLRQKGATISALTKRKDQLHEAFESDLAIARTEFISDDTREEPPLFPCLREALSEMVQPLALAEIRIAIADFLKHYKFTQQYPDARDLSNHSIHHMDSLATPLFAAFNRDMAAYLRHLREELTGWDDEILEGEDSERRHNEFVNNGIVSLATISSIPSSVTSLTHNEFSVPPSFALKDFLGASVPPPDSATTPAPSKVPDFLAKNLAPGVALPLMAGLSLDPAPAVATVGRGLTFAVTSQTLPGGSAAEMNVNLISQEESPATVHRGTTKKDDTKSRVAKHNLQTVVRVKSLRLFELSAFSAELRRGGESIPIVPPFIELPIIGSFARFPVKPSVVYHRSFAIVSAVVLPTAADLATTVTASPDLIISPAKLTLTAKPAAGKTTLTYRIVARRQNGDTIRSGDETADGSALAASPVKLSWNSLGDDVRYDIYRNEGGNWKLLITDVKGTHYEDKGVVPGVPAVPKGVPDVLPSFAVITPASFLAGTVNEFHRQMLKCIAKEAEGGLAPLAHCNNLTLATP